MEVLSLFFRYRELVSEIYTFFTKCFLEGSYVDIARLYALFQ
jgi:hypothetical protein